MPELQASIFHNYFYSLNFISLSPEYYKKTGLLEYQRKKNRCQQNNAHMGNSRRFSGSKHRDFPFHQPNTAKINYFRRKTRGRSPGRNHHLHRRTETFRRILLRLGRQRQKRQPFQHAFSISKFHGQGCRPASARRLFRTASGK